MTDNIERHLAQFEAYNRRDLDALVRDVRDDAVFTDHALGQTFTGVAAIRGWTQAQLDGFSDDRVDVIDAFGEGDRTVVRYTSRGTHDGLWGGIEPTLRTVETSVCDVVRWEDGMIVEDHVFYDLYGPLQQLGQVAPLTTPA